MDTSTRTPPPRRVRIPSLLRLDPGDPAYPLRDGGWQTWPGGPALFVPLTPSPSIVYTGSLAVLQRPCLSLICSSHCPGTIALETYRIARNALAAGPTVIGGFHSPMERTVFDLLSVHHVPIVFCPGRRLNTKSIPVAWAPGILDGRLLVASPFGPGQRRVDRELAGMRNAFVAALAQEIFVPYARPGGAVAALVAALIEQGRTVLTLKDPENTGIVAMGAVPWETDALIWKLRTTGR
jgi:hypothetical protein